MDIEAAKTSPARIEKIERPTKNGQKEHTICSTAATAVPAINYSVHVS
jgi:hypothetical protein